MFRIAALVALVAGGGLGGYAYYARATQPGTLIIESMPSGAEVVVNGEDRGVTPLRLEVPPGDHHVELRRGDAARQLTLHVEPGESTTERVDLANVKPVGSLAVASEPSGAKVSVDGRNRGITPLTIEDLALGSHNVVIESPSGTVYRTVTIKAGTRASLSEPIFSGWLAVFAPFELQILANKRPIGTTETERLMLAPGRYDVELVNRPLKFRQSQTVVVESGKPTVINIKSADGLLRVNAPEGAEVLVDGHSLGRTPLGDQRVAIGTRDVVVRHPRFGERRTTVTVTPAETATVTIEGS
jgi:hypothetical protein